MKSCSSRLILPSPTRCRAARPAAPARLMPRSRSASQWALAVVGPVGYRAGPHGSARYPYPPLLTPLPSTTVASITARFELRPAQSGCSCLKRTGREPLPPFPTSSTLSQRPPSKRAIVPLTASMSPPKPFDMPATVVAA